MSAKSSRYNQVVVSHSSVSAVGLAPTIGVPGSDLGWMLGVILRRWHEQVEGAVEGVPHGTRGYQILSMIGHNEPPTQSGLARHLNIDKTVMPYIIDSLEQGGLLVRRVDSNDRRVKRIVITPEGAALLSELEAKVRQAEDEVFGDVSPALRDHFVDSAERLALSIHTAQPGTDACAAVLEALTDPATSSRA
jgi:DNA-binding MarR family transcriptional regulator